MSLGEQAVARFGNGFNNSRQHENRPKLPPKYKWDNHLMYAYSPPGYYQLNYDEVPRRRPTRQTPKDIHLAKSGPVAHWPKRWAAYLQKCITRRTSQPEFVDPRVAVFCHRGLYDRAMKIPENSILAIHNGQENRLRCHELDARICEDGAAHKSFLAHDEVGGRISAKKRRWTSLNLQEILETTLVDRRFNLETEDFASTYESTGEKVPGLEAFLEYARSTPTTLGLTLQLDLRENDFPRAIEWFSRRMLSPPMLMLKGYNLTFASGDELKAAVVKIREDKVNNRASQHGEYPGPVDVDDSKPFNWGQLKKYRVRIIVVFYGQPIVQLALKRFSLKDHQQLSYDQLLETATEHIKSFEQIMQPGVDQFIPEIVHSGLGLGYSVKKDRAKNPLDGKPIKDPEAIFASRLDRAMIQVALDLGEKYPKMIFSSCVRLCEVRTPGPNGKELVADMKTGRLKPRPTGEKGIATKLRTIHGGLYPQSHIVVADDPFAEIAARIWIDEYAKLDRKQLLTIADSNLTYNKWLRKGGRKVKTAVNALNGPFLPNTYDGPVDDDWNMPDADGSKSNTRKV